MIAIQRSPRLASRPRLLLIAYQFPPVGGAGVQRVTKFTKFLPRQGWDVSVLTVSNPSVPLSDESLSADVPRDTILRRARTWEPGYGLKSSLGDAAAPASLRAKCIATGKRWAKRVAAAVLQPDPQILWAPAALAEGRRLLREVRHDAILASGPPFSSFLIAARLARQSNLPLVLDYRDEWTISNRYWENKSNGALPRWISQRLQTSVLRQASHVLATTDESTNSLRETVHRAGSSTPVSCLWNGFDADDMHCDDDPQTLETKSSRSTFQLAHVGTLWRLTTAAPLLAAVERLAERNARIAERLELKFLGRCTPAEQTDLQRLAPLSTRVSQVDYVPHAEAVRTMHRADELCVLLADVPEASRVMPAKTFEYLATGRPILAIAPPGEMRRVLANHPGVAAYDPSDIAGICEHLERRLQTDARPADVVRELDCYDRNEQSKQLASLLNGLTGRQATDESVFDSRAHATLGV